MTAGSARPGAVTLYRITNDGDWRVVMACEDGEVTAEQMVDMWVKTMGGPAFRVHDQLAELHRITPTLLQVTSLVSSAWSITYLARQDWIEAEQPQLVDDLYQPIE